LPPVWPRHITPCPIGAASGIGLPMYRLAPIPIFASALMLAACQSGSPQGNGAPGDSADRQPYAGIAPDEVLHFTGTEPFWGGEVAGSTLTYTTPENPDGWTIRVQRFAGRNGLSFSGALEGQDFVAAISPGQCSDAMSDRVYPFNITLQIGREVRNGCAWSDAQPFSGTAVL